MKYRFEYSRAINGSTLADNFKFEEEKKKYDRKCKVCGYTNRVLSKYGKIPCKNCGNYVFSSDKEEFKYRMKELL